MISRNIDLDGRPGTLGWLADDAAALRTTPGPLMRLWARARAGALNQALTDGVDPSTCRQLQARAFELTSAGFRASLADTIERLLSAARRRPSRMCVAPCAQATLANERELRELATLLRGELPLYARGLAALDQMLSDGCGPVYVGDGDALARRLDELRTALRGAL